ncbi:MAG: hypothetical protein KTR32_27385 [Granulosicoccus sp.]|nr:hypothetical protein [Granulosicoccus sp.]
MQRPATGHAVVKSTPDHDDTYPAQAPLRDPETVMRLSRMGSFYPTRLSFMRTLMRQISGVRVKRPVWDISAEGFGRAVYSLTLGRFTYSLVAFATPLDPANRTDRVIAEAWDATFVLFDGVPAAEDLERLQSETPKQEAGRFSESELVLSRANKSVRLFEHVTERLAAGQQPDEDMIRSIGYLLRTTAVYGNGKFGIADRLRICERPVLSGPFQVELLTVWLIRGFTQDLVEHVAWSRAPDTFVPLERRLRRYLGVGNSTGLGMAPFLVSHPVLINNWMLVRETALARVQAIESADPENIERLLALSERVKAHLHEWNVDDTRQQSRIEQLRVEFGQWSSSLTAERLSSRYPFAALLQESNDYSEECQELAVALVLEPHGRLIDGLEECMVSVTHPVLEPVMTTSSLLSLIEGQWHWALAIDFTDQCETHQFWYVSEDKLEPRLGLRHQEPGSELESPLDIARQVQSLYRYLKTSPADQSVASLLLEHPEFRFATVRIQALEQYPYGEIRDNLIGHNCLPIDMLRCKLSFFGAAKFDPRSDRWTRITLYQGAPLLDELDGDVDDWWLPTLASTA